MKEENLGTTEAVEVKTLFIPSKKSFNLSKVKLTTGGGLDTHYEVLETAGNESYNNKYHVESAKDIHPDLKKQVNRLKSVVARVYHMNFIRTLMLMPEFEATAKQQELAETGLAEIMQKINVTGVAISGTDKNVGIVITATFTADSNQKMAINTHRMKFTDTRYGVEEEMEEICSEIENEVYAFLFENKKAQLDIFDSMNSNDEEDELEEVEDGKMKAAGE